MADHNLEREDALWKTQESFGWTIAPDVNFDWTSNMVQSRKDSANNDHHHRPTTAPTTTTARLPPSAWSQRLLQLPTSTKQRGMPKGVHPPRPTKGTSVRFLSTQRQSDQNDARFLPQYSSYYASSPYLIRAPPITKEVRRPPPPAAGGDTLPESAKEWLTKQSVTMHGGKRSRGLSSTQHPKIASSSGLSPPRPSQQQMAVDLSSQTSNMTHAKMLGRQLSFSLNYPKRIKSEIRGNVHVLMLKHSFAPVPPKNWPIKKTIGRREGCRVVVEWQGTTSNVWNLLREMNLLFDKILLISCADFYLLERAHMYCRTWQEGSMPVLQRYKLITLNVLQGQGNALAFEESPLQKAERNRKFMIQFNAMEKLRKQANDREEKKLFMKNIRARAELFKGPTKPPMESLSRHRRTSNVEFGGELRTKTSTIHRNELNGPGSFITPLAMGKQLETRKKNVITITSLSTVEQRPSPEKHVPLGMREGPGPAHYDAFDPSTVIPRIKLGPGFTSGKETPEHIVCKKLYTKWHRKDVEIAKEQRLLEKEMNRIQHREDEMLIMSRGLRKIASERMAKNGLGGGVKKRKTRRKKKKTVKVVERVGW